MQIVKKSLVSALVVCATLAAAQSPGKKTPAVMVAPVDLVSVTRGKGGPVTIHFRVPPGYHINSNTPKSEFLIPTALKLDAPTDIAITKVTYPEGKDMKFPFAPDEPLSVYTGDFAVSMTIRPLHTVQPGKYAIHGDLKYQACDNAACYPPKHLPVDFEVKVLKNAVVGKGNPAQSPHAHR
jgi:Disulphide bond corrector protein DsbC